MNRRTVALAAVALVAVLAVACDTGGRAADERVPYTSIDEWVRYTSIDAGFSALFPVQPSQDTQIEVTEFGDLEFDQFAAVGEDGTTYMVMYGDMSAVTRVFTPDEMLDAVAPRVIQRSSGELIHELIIDIDGYPGREVKVRTAGGSIFKLRAYLVGNRNYQIVVITSPEDQFSADVGRFLDSFELESIDVSEPSDELQWERFTSAEGGYSFLVPYPPEVETIAGDTGEFTRYWMVVDSTQFIAISSEVPPEDLADYGPDEIAGFVVDGMVALTSGTLLYDEQISLDGAPGREFRIQTNAGRILQMRAYQIGKWQYQIGVFSNPEDQSDPDITLFMDSFQLQ